MRNVLLASMGVLVLGALALTGSYFYRERAEKVQEQALETVQQEASAFAAQLAWGLGASQRVLNDLATQEAVITLFVSADEAALSLKGDELAGQFPSALKLRLLKPGVNEVDTSTFPPLSYASLDLLRKAEASEDPIPAEVLFFGSPSQHIVMVRRVTNGGGGLVGVLHLSVDVGVLGEAMQGLSLSKGYAELHQAVHEGETLVLAHEGDGAAKARGAPVVLPVANTGWRLAYWHQAAADPARAPGSSGSGFWGLTGGIGVESLILVVVILGALSVYVIFRRGRRKAAQVMAETAVYAGAVQGIMLGAHPGLERLVPGLPKTAQHAGGTAAAQPSSRAARGARASPAPAAPGGAEQAPTSAKAQAVTESSATPAVREEQVPLPKSIFRAYDIRGVAGKTLTAASVHAIGRAIGSEAHERGQQKLVVGRDGRKSSPELAEALIQGLRAAGRDVIDIGMVPTPLVYFATHHLNTGSGVMVTGSHNPPNYNGLKIMLGGETLSGDAVMALRDRVTGRKLVTGNGKLKSRDITGDYMRRVNEEIPVALDHAFKLVIDCGNGVAGILAPEVLRALGHEVVELYCDVDGNFPNHQPDPSQPENLRALIDRVKQEKADLGLAFDGDGDRLGVIDGAGNIIWPDRQMMLFARDVLSRAKGAPIIFDVKCSRHLRRVIEEHGGKPVMWKTGHSLIKHKMKEENAPLAGELSGHIFFKERWYGFDDAIYAAARMLEILGKSKKSPEGVFAELPGGIATPELRLSMPERSHASFMKDFCERAVFDEAKITTIDGLRVDFPDGWALIRPSNTTPHLILRFEGDDQQALDRIQDAFRRVFQELDPKLQLPF
ncbi:MAG: phosphomannomutase/phosphoglucomutase [Gammaproteobacteria bacterium]